MDLEAAREDTLVAAVAAACTVGLTLGLRYGVGVSAGLLPRLTPLVPYGGYLVIRRTGLGEPLSAPRTWAVVTLAVTAVAFLALSLPAV
jgi:hypothetical protein